MTRRINAPDTPADVQLRACLDRIPRVSFIMIAGAGSGKTTSLVKSLAHIVVTKGDSLKRQGQRIACITYTEIAAKEIWNDVGNNPLIHVSTIHSFLWSIIRPFQADIKKWVESRIAEKVLKLKTTIANYGSRVQQKTKEKDAREIAKLEELTKKISGVTLFNYGTGSNYLKGILGHDDIVKLVPALIQERPMLNLIVSQKFPYVFVDESQDTFPDIVAALKKVDHDHSSSFCLGFFGDPMQKIYATGAGDIPVEEGWEIITKPENFRCSQQVLKVINAIRKSGDGLEQTRGRVEQIDGKTVPVAGSGQIFIVPSDNQRTENLIKIQQWCVKHFNDCAWQNDSDIKIFVIVHRMAAKRLGFSNLYSAMNDEAPSSFKDGFLEGTAWPLKPFISFVLPLINHLNANQQFEALNLLRAQSPLLTSDKVKSENLDKIFGNLKKASGRLLDMMKPESTANVLDVLKLINENELAVLDARILDHMNDTVSQPTSEQGEENSIATEIASMKKYFGCPAHEFLGYKKYYESESPFATQQGIKGAEFDRVMTILDDDEGTHNLFSYGKYFGVTELSDTDQQNIQAGKDNVITRTRRLFYVSCSRARRDLVAVYYTADVDSAQRQLEELAIFSKDKIYTLADLAHSGN